MQRKLAHEDGDVEERAEAGQVPQLALVRSAARSHDVGLEVERGAVYAPNADGTTPDPKRVDGPRWDGGGVACRQSVPLVPNQDVQRALEHLVHLGQARMHVRLR